MVPASSGAIGLGSKIVTGYALASWDLAGPAALHGRGRPPRVGGVRSVAGRDAAWAVGYGGSMHTLLARVVRGRIVLDEPTSLPEGAEVEVVVMDDDLSPTERAELHASIDRALDDADAGRAVDASEFLASHRAGRTGQ